MPIISSPGQITSDNEQNSVIHYPSTSPRPTRPKNKSIKFSVPDTPHFAEKKLKLDSKLDGETNLLFDSHVDRCLSPRASGAM